MRTHAPALKVRHVSALVRIFGAAEPMSAAELVGQLLLTLPSLGGQGSERFVVVLHRVLRLLGVPGHQVGDRRLIGGWPPSAVWRR